MGDTEVGALIVLGLCVGTLAAMAGIRELVVCIIGIGALVAFVKAASR